MVLKIHGATGLFLYPLETSEKLIEETIGMKIKVSKFCFQF